MALYDYTKALKMGRKQYQAAVLKGEYPYLPVLDDILSNTEIVSEVNLGIMDIPLEKIVGTRTQGRTQAFASNFMPLLGEKTEFGAKWSMVCDHQIQEGIHDPVVAYEFMNRYYIQEGNKRVSVLKYVHAYSVPASVTRLIPKKTDDLDTRLYYEFLDFYQVSFNCDVWFSKEGCYRRLLKEMGRGGEVWDEDTRMYFKSAHDQFTNVFHARRTDEIEMTASDAFLIYVEIFGYETVRSRTKEQMQRDLEKIWEELMLKSRGGKVALVEKPQETPPQTLIDWLVPSPGLEPEKLKLAFFYVRDQEISSWVYAHELGRAYLDQCFEGRLRTLAFYHIETEADMEKSMLLALEAGCNVFITTAPQMASQSVKAAVEHQGLMVFNCSLNMSYSSIYTYYVRTYESKFLMGALAAAMSESDHLGYVADYPIYGRIASINAFAMGAMMINPRAKIHLKWSGLKQDTSREELEAENIRYICGEDMITPQKASREFGLYHRLEDGRVENLATQICDWGHFYERLVHLICRQSLDAEGIKGKKAINYWWGMSADVLDVICSDSLPYHTKRLIHFLKGSIRSGDFQPFDGLKNGCGLTPDEIVRMDWLADNLIGSIPSIDQFRDEAREIIRLQGVRTENQITEE